MYIDCSPVEEQYLFHAKTSRNEKDVVPLLACTCPASDMVASAYGEAIIAKAKEIVAVAIEYCVTESRVKDCVETWNNQPSVHGILAISPPKTLLNPHSLITDSKNVEGNDFDDRLDRVSCTAKAIVAVMAYIISLDRGETDKFLGGNYSYPNLFEDKNVVIIGYGKAVGKPLSYLLMRYHVGSVTTIHKYTSQTTQQNAIRSADIIVSATGNPHIFPSMVGCTAGNHFENKVIIDAGISKVGDKIVGDIDPVFAENNQVTRVPGGVGAVTTAMILYNALQACRGQLT